MSPDTHSKIFTLATQRETRPVVCAWPQVEYRAASTKHHQSLNMVDKTKQTEIQTALISDACLRRTMEMMHELEVTDSRENFSPPSRQGNVFKTSWVHWCITVRWKVWYKLNIVRNNIRMMTTPGPHLNNESEPMWFLFVSFFQQSGLCGVTCSCLCSFQPVHNSLLCNVVMGKRKRKKSVRKVLFYFVFWMLLPCLVTWERRQL